MSETIVCIPTCYVGKPLAYDTYLRVRGYDAEIRGRSGPIPAPRLTGMLQNGWLLVHADKQARVPDGTRKLPIRRGARCSSSMRPAPMAGLDCCICPISNRIGLTSRRQPTMIMQAITKSFAPWRDNRSGATRTPSMTPSWICGCRGIFRATNVRRRVIPAYMGLIKQIDDQLGPLFAFLDARGLTDQTMIVVDPLPRADATRGTTCDALVEAIDLAPTFVEYFGGTPPRHILEGRSLMPLLRGQRPDGWRRCVFSEYDYSMQDVRQALRQPIDKCRLFMALRSLEIYPCPRLSADAVRSAGRSTRTARPRHRSGP